jgi:hypothetical protein
MITSVPTGASKRSVENVCHWLCQCFFDSGSIGNVALTEPVAHVESGRVDVQLADS